MSVGIRIQGGGNIKIIDGSFIGFEQGIEASDCQDLVIDGNDFKQVNNCIKARNVQGLKANNNNDDFYDQQFKSSIVAYYVHLYVQRLRGLHNADV